MTCTVHTVRIESKRSLRHLDIRVTAPSQAALLARSRPAAPAGPAAGGAEMCMRRRVAPAARARPVVPVGPTAGGTASRCAVQLRCGPLAARVVHQVGRPVRPVVAPN